MSDLRVARRDRVFTAMADGDLDVLVLGRRDSVAYATGMRSLWTAGTRPFGPACVLVAAHRSTHLLSTWDAGVPPEIPFEHLYGVTWNPAVMGEALRAIVGFPDARRIGVDALSPGFDRAVRRLAPDATLVPADDLLARTRAVKLPAELDRIRAARAVARIGLEAALGATEHRLAAALRAMAAQGATVPTSPPTVHEADGRIQVDLAVLVDGYEGSLARTVGRTGEPDPTAPVHQALVAACRHGASGADLRTAARQAGATTWLVRGSGMGFEAPVVDDDIGEHAVIEAGTVLAVQVEVDGWRRRDLVVVTGR